MKYHHVEPSGGINTLQAAVKEPVSDCFNCHKADVLSCDVSITKTQTISSLKCYSGCNVVLY